MKFTILIGTLALAATTFTTIAHASAAFGGLDKQCFKALRKEWTSCNNGSGSSAKLPDFKFNMKSNDKSRKNNNGNVGIGSTNNNDPGTGPDTNSDAGNEDTGTGPDTDTDNSSQPDNNNGGGNNTNLPQSNSNDIKGFDPSTGLYGPGT
jgi:hypothetical protein